MYKKIALKKPIGSLGDCKDQIAPCLILTATVDPEDMVFTKRNDPKVRLEDYKRSLTLWLNEPSVYRIVFCENSLYDITDLIRIAEQYEEADKRIEFLSFYGQDFPKERGKGYGELKILSHICQRSYLFNQSQSFIKVTGRLYVKNIQKIVAYLSKSEVDIMCKLNANLSWADTRCFGGSTAFLERYLLPLSEQIHDVEGIFLEHVLARASHKAMSEGKKWALPPVRPNFIGISGTDNKTYATSWVGAFVKQRSYDLKRWVFSR
ncbi:hypothetical protein [Rubrobacter naiadicus]|uniref:hypothetical protein n=1 Tax=Rubrobacter naiadicus TaxID=1392641 RepID=UPI002360EEC4|nr:hypothetical protein [Rubrobacter naiadicus]